MLLLAIVFMVTLALTGGAYLITQRTLENRESAKVRDRLAGRDARKKSDEKAVAGKPLFVGEDASGKTLVQRLITKLSLDRALQTLIEQAGVNWAPGQVVLGSLGAALVAVNVIWYLAHPAIRPFVAPLALTAGALPVGYLRLKRKRRIAAFEAQFPDALQFISRAMKAGHAFSVSLEMLHREFSQPLSGEFRRTFEEQNLGLPIDTALDKLARRMPLLDVQFFVAAVVLQKRTGGNLAEILDNLATLIRERFKLRGQIRAVSAQGRMSSMVLTAIPLVVSGILYFVNRPHMLFFLEEETGRWMALLAAGFVAVGFLVMQQIVKIEV